MRSRDAAVLRRTAPRRSHEAGGVRVVHHDQRVIVIGEIADGAQIRDRAVHREHTVGGDEAGSGAGRLLQTVLELRHVVVGIAIALRLAEANAVDDARVIERIGNDGVALIQQCFEQAAVGVEARGIEDRVFFAQEPAQALLELLVDALGAADEAHRGHAVAEAIDSAVGRFPDGRLIREARGSCWRTD